MNSMDEIILTREKIAANCRVTKELIHEATVKFGMDGMDYVYDTLTAQIEAFLLSRINETQTIKITRRPQNFIDWILRRDQHFEFKIECREVMKNPPKLKESVFLYKV